MKQEQKLEIFEEIVDLEAISAQLLMLYEGYGTGSFTASNEIQAAAIDGIRRYLNRVISELQDIDCSYDLIPRQRAAS